SASARSRGGTARSRLATVREANTRASTVTGSARSRARRAASPRARPIRADSSGPDFWSARATSIWLMLPQAALRNRTPQWGRSAGGGGGVGGGGWAAGGGGRRGGWGGSQKTTSRAGAGGKRTPIKVGSPPRAGATPSGLFGPGLARPVPFFIRNRR